MSGRSGKSFAGTAQEICRPGEGLLQVLQHIHKLYPNVHIKVTNSTSIDCARILENGQVDFIITNYPNSGLLNTHSVRAIREFRDVFVASADHFPLRDKTFTLAELLDFAYQYPGMNKVLQAAGRVIRTTEDEGIILLLDDRFLKKEYLELFPIEWEHFQMVNRKNVGQCLSDFWESRGR